jgi:hypothetical protein
MGFFEALKTGLTETVRGIAQDPKAFAKDVGTSFNNTAKTIVKGTTQVALDAGEGVPRAVIAATGKEQPVVPPTTLPGVLGKWLGPMQSYSSQVAQGQKEGKSAVDAAKGPAIDFALNEPLGVAAKPLFLGGGFILREGMERGAPFIKDMAGKIGWTKSVSKIKEHLGGIFDATPKELTPLANELKNVTDPVQVEKIIQDKITDTKIPTAPEGADMFTHNVKNLNVPTEAKDRILSEVAPLKSSMEKINGTPMTFTEVAEQAKKTGAVLEQTIGKQETLDMAAAARNTRDAIAGFAEKAQKGALTKEDVTLLYDQFSALDSYGSDLGRRLNDLKAVATPQEFSVIEDMISKMRKMGVSKDDFLKMADNYDLNTAEGQLAMYRDLVKPNAEHWFDTLRMNSMLSSPATHFSNIIANYQGTGIMRPIVKGVEGAVDATRAILTGGPRTRFTGEVLPYLKGYYNPETLKVASKDAWNVLKGAIDVANVDLRQMPKAKPGTVLGGIESVLSVPMRALESMDIFFQRLTSAGEKAALDYRTAKGVKPSAVDTYGEAMYGVGGNAKKADDLATKELFRSNIVQQGEGKLVNAVGQVARGLQHYTYNENPLIRIPAKLVLPFIRTPTNILKTGLEYNPLSGALNLYGNTNKTEQVAKMIVGASMIAPLVTKGLSGEITFGYPTDPAAREAQRAANIPEYSIKIGDNWYSYARMHPSIAFNLAMIGAVSQAVHENKYNEEKGTEIAKALSISSLKFLSGQAYLKSLGNFMDAMQGEEGKMAQFVSNVPQQAVPFRAMLSWVNRLMTENQSKIDTEKGFGSQVLQSIMLQIPGLSDDLTPRTDINGKPLKNTGAFVEGNKYEAVLNALGVTTTKVTEEDMKMYNSYNEARLYKKAINAQSKEDKKNLDAFVTVFKSLNNATEKKIALQNYMSANPQMQGKIIDALSKTPRTLTYEEKQIDSMPIKDGSRGKYIQAKLKTMKTPEEKKAWLASLYKNKILTRDVLMSLTQTSKSGAPEPQIQGE